jgi:hypothetical protein
LCALGLAVLFVSVGHAQTVVCPATTDAEWDKLIASKPEQATFIRTVADWSDFKAGARFRGHPLNGLKAQQLADFSASLWIRDGGVVTLNFRILKDNLSPSAYGAVLAAFGIHVALLDDHTEYECWSPHNCKYNVNYICMSGC